MSSRKQRIDFTGVVAFIDDDPTADIKLDDSGRFYEIPDSMARAFEANEDEIPIMFEHSEQLPGKNAKDSDKKPLKPLGKVKKFYVGKAKNRRVLKMDAQIDNPGFITALQRMTYDYNNMHKPGAYGSSDKFIRGGKTGTKTDVTAKQALTVRFPGLSISHRLINLNKPKEVSVCSAGARHGTLITDATYFADGGEGQDPSVSEDEVQPYSRAFNSLNVMGLNVKKGNKIKKDAELIGMDVDEVMSFTLKPEDGEEGETQKPPEEEPRKSEEEEAISPSKEREEPTIPPQPISPVPPQIQPTEVSIQEPKTTIIQEPEPDKLNNFSKEEIIKRHEEQVLKEFNEQTMAATMSDVLQQFVKGQAELKEMLMSQNKPATSTPLHAPEPRRPKRSPRYSDDEYEPLERRDRSPINNKRRYRSPVRQEEEEEYFQPERKMKRPSSRYYQDDDVEYERRVKRVYEPRYERYAPEPQRADPYFYQQQQQHRQPMYARQYDEQYVQQPPQYMQQQRQPIQQQQPRVVYQQAPPPPPPPPAPEPKIVYVDENGYEIPEPKPQPVQQQIIKRVVVKSAPQPPPPGTEEPMVEESAPVKEQATPPPPQASTSDNYSMQPEPVFVAKTRAQHFEDLIKNF
ncbi:ORF71 [Haliotid herpesvirus 1]|nr:ORF71 [Haliotid herpesvirus 1]